MRNETGSSEPGRLYTTAHAAHYETKDLGKALVLYRGIMAAHPDSQEAAYSRSQINNIVKAVVPEQELFDAQLDLAMARFAPGLDRSEAGFSTAKAEDSQ